MAAIGVAASAAAVHAEDGHYRTFDIAAGPLSSAIVAFGNQAGVSIAGTDPSISRERLRRAIRGKMPFGVALRRLLDGTDLRAIRITATLYRVERIPRRTPPSPPRDVHPIPNSAIPDAADIVVTASKQEMSLDDYPGSVHVLNSKDLSTMPGVAADTRAIVDALPTLAMTSLGPGREKLFVRGIADSSLAGASQATVGQYVGEVQLNYSAPDPGLLLYDVARTEVLEGPQGTLYGTGALGGIVRVVPNAPAIGRVEGAIGGGVDAVAHGGRGVDGMAMLNLPLTEGAAVRLVGYASHAPGYVDDHKRGLRDVNDGDTLGGRATVRWLPGSDWTVDAGGAYQRIDNADGQYTDASSPGLTRASAIAQPSSNRFAMGFVSAVRDYGSAQSLTLTASLVDNRLTAQYDATLPGEEPNGIITDIGSHVLNGEIRFARRRDAGPGFVLGAYATISDDEVVHSIITEDMAQGQKLFVRSIGNRIVDVALYGEASIAIADHLVATGGVRATYLRFTGSNSLPGSGPDRLRIDVAGSGSLAVMPTAALNWKPRSSVAAHLSYRRGSRVGGYALRSLPFDDGSPNVGSDSYFVFRPDTIDLVEAGLQLGGAHDVLQATAALSAARWRNIQSDLYGYAGPYTVNVGNGEVFGAELSLVWRPGPDTRLSAAAFAARSRLSDPDPEFAGQRVQALPNTPALTTRVAVDHAWRFRDDQHLRGVLAMRYVGRSRVGVGPLHVPQGDLVSADASLSWVGRRRTISLYVSNLLDGKGNRFSLGNPLSAPAGLQRVPLQPRTIGLSFTFDVG